MSAIAQMIWTLIGPTLVSIALNFGIPEAIKWATEKGWPKWIITIISGFLSAALEQLSKMKQVVVTASTDIRDVKADPNLSRAEKVVLVRSIKNQAKREAKRNCSGVGCESETKAL